MRNEILNVLNRFAGEDIHIYEDIPQNKLQTAIKSYPIDNNDTVLALIDATVFGSAKVGMAIGIKGIYFKNDWSTPTRKSFFSWEDLKGKKVEKGSMFCILISPGSEFNVSGATISRDVLINLLNSLIELYSEDKALTPSISSENNYQNIIPSLVALSIVADGVVDDSEIDTAFSIIENDELIEDKAEAYKKLNFYVNDLLLKKQNSQVLFKLKTAEIIASISKITDIDEKEKILIILDGMNESVSGEGKLETDLITNKIKDKISVIA